MPKVEIYQPNQVAVGVTQGPQARDLPIGAFPGAHLGQGLSDLAKGVQALSQRVDIAETESAAVAFEQEQNDLLFSADTGYFNTQGRDAYDNAGQVQQKLRKLAEDHAAQLTNPRAKAAFNKVANQHILRAQRDINQHAHRGLVAWEDNNSDARVKSSIQTGSLHWGDDHDVQVQHTAGRNELIDFLDRKRITGDAKNKKLNQFDTDYASAVISTAASTTGEAGRQALNDYGDMIKDGIAKAKITKIVEAKEKADEERAQSREAVVQADSILSDNGYDRQATEAAINDIKDPIVQQKARREAAYQITQHENILVADRIQAQKSVEDFVKNGGSVEEFKSQDIDTWNTLSLAQQGALEKASRTNNFSDWFAFQTKTTAEVAKMSPDQVGRLAANLDTSHREKLLTQWKAAREGKGDEIGRTRASTIKSAVLGIFGETKDSDLTSKQKKKSDHLYELINAEHEFRKQNLGRELDGKEFTTMMHDFTREIILDKGIIYDTTTSMEDLVDDLPPEDIDRYTSWLHSAGINVTTKELYNISKNKAALNIQPKDLVSTVDYLASNNKNLTVDNILKTYKQSGGK